MKILTGGLFSGCILLYRIIIPKNIENLDYFNYGVFTNSGLKEIIFEEGVKSIGSYTFYNCKNL